MPSPELGRAEIDRFLTAAGSALAGDWVLVGGAAAALWFAPNRTTADIDLVGPEGTMDERIRLMDLALAEGLPIEAVNSAADFFLRRIPSWRDDLEVLHAGPSATIYRPTATLFLLLKCARLSEQDLADCEALLDFARAHAVPLDRDRVLAALAALPATEDAPLAARRAALRRGVLGPPRGGVP